MGGIMRARTLLLMLAGWVLAAESFADGALAPDFALRSLESGNVRLSEYRSDVVLLSFWSSRCNPCRESRPMLRKLRTRYGDAGLQLLAVDVDGDPERVRDYAGALEWPVLLDSKQSVSRIYEPRTLPASVLIDREGRILARYTGIREHTTARLDADIAAAVAN